MTNRIRFLAATATLLLAAGPLRAGEVPEWGPYVAMDVGTTTFSVRPAESAQWPINSSGATRRDRSDATYSLAAGFRFSPGLAIEASYLDLGQSSYLVEDQGRAIYLQQGSHGAALSLLGALQINRTWSVEGRLGAYFGRSRLHGWVDLELDSDGLEFVGGKGGADAGLMVGGSLVASFAGRWQARLGYDYLDDKAAEIHDPDLGARTKSSAARISVGLRYLF